MQYKRHYRLNRYCYLGSIQESKSCNWLISKGKLHILQGMDCSCYLTEHNYQNNYCSLFHWGMFYSCCYTFCNSHCQNNIRESKPSRNYWNYLCRIGSRHSSFDKFKKNQQNTRWNKRRKLLSLCKFCKEPSKNGKYWEIQLCLGKINLSMIDTSTVGQRK